MSSLTCIEYLLVLSIVALMLQLRNGACRIHLPRTTLHVSIDTQCSTGPAGILCGEHVKPPHSGCRPYSSGRLLQEAQPDARGGQHLCDPSAVYTSKHGLHRDTQRNKVSERPLGLAGGSCLWPPEVH